MTPAPTAQHAVASRSDRYPRRLLSTKVPVFTPLTTDRAQRQAPSPTAVLRTVSARHLILTLTLALRVRALRNRSHPTAAAVRTAARTLMVADRVTLTALEATLTR
jgi:hypothetical protein